MTIFVTATPGVSYKKIDELVQERIAAG